MAVLEPTLALLDETDSGLDIDALRVVSDGVNAMRSPERAFIVVTHYQRLLNYIVPDFVHVLSEGRIVRSGGRELALELEEKGYAGSPLRERDGDGNARAGPRVGQGTPRPGIPSIRGGRVSDDAPRRLAVHEHRADCGREVPAGERHVRTGVVSHRGCQDSRRADAGHRQRPVRRGTVGSERDAERRAHRRPS
jgi:hypothetical protein